MDSLPEVKQEVKIIRDKQHASEVSMSVLEAVAQERHTLLLEQITNLKDSIKQNREEVEAQNTKIIESIDKVNIQINALSTLAIQGKTSLKTFWFLGGIIVGISGFIATWWEYLKF